MGFLRFLRDNAPFLSAGVMLSFSSSYGQTYFISVFAGQIMASFSLSDGQWGGIYTLGTTASALTMIWAGALTDRYRIRALALVFGPLLALACLAMAAAPSALWLIPVIFLLRLGGQGMMSHLSIVAMARWFVATRGRALSVSAMGYAGGQAILPVVIAAGMTMVDWRWLWVGAALLMLLTLPVLTRLLRAERTPQSVAREQVSLGMGGRHWTRSEVLRHPLFWLAVPMLLGPPSWGTALFFQQVHFAGVKGWELVDYVALLPLYTAVSVAATFAAGAWIDRFGSATLTMVYMLPFAAAFFILYHAQTLPMAALGLAVFGIGTGVQATLPAAFWSEFFGTRHIGAIKAMAGAIMVFGSAIGPGITGGLIDLGYDFAHQMIWIVGYFLFAALMVTLGMIPARRQLSRAA